VITGPPGAGKSTVAAALAGRFDPSVLVGGDAFFDFLATGAIEPWLPEATRQNEVTIRAAAAATAEFVAGGYPTVFDGIVGPWFLPVFMAAVRVSTVQYVLLLPTLDHCLTRVATRADHQFDDPAATRKMHAEFAGAEIDARHVLDPPEGVDAVTDLIVAGIAEGRYLHSATGEERA
jgi:Fe-S cluster assembly ATPase SufC